MWPRGPLTAYLFFCFLTAVRNNVLFNWFLLKLFALSMPKACDKLIFSLSFKYSFILCSSLVFLRNMRSWRHSPKCMSTSLITFTLTYGISWYFNHMWAVRGTKHTQLKKGKCYPLVTLSLLDKLGMILKSDGLRWVGLLFTKHWHFISG